MSASSSVKTGIQARMNRIEQRDRVKQSKTRKPINLLRWVILIACVLFAILSSFADGSETCSIA